MPIAVLLALLASSAALAAERLRVDDAGALAALFTDRTFYGRYADGTPWTEYYAPDGRLGYWDGCPHAGEWWIADGSACFHYPTFVGSPVYCFDVYRGEKRFEFVTAGAMPTWPPSAYTVAIARGNVQGLSLTASGCRIVRAPDEAGRLTPP